MTSHRRYNSLLLLPAGIFLIGYLFTAVTHRYTVSGWLMLLFFVTLAFVFRGFAALKGFSFTVMIFAPVSMAIHYRNIF